MGGNRSGRQSFGFCTPLPVYVTMPRRMSACTCCTTCRMPAFIGSQVSLGLLSHWLDERSTTISAVGVRDSKPIASWLQPTRSAASSPKVGPTLARKSPPESPLPELPWAPVGPFEEPLPPPPPPPALQPKRPTPAAAPSASRAKPRGKRQDAMDRNIRQASTRGYGQAPGRAGQYSQQPIFPAANVPQAH